MTAAAGSRIPQTCRDCGQTFMALGAWQTRCRPCYARYKARADAERAASQRPPIPPDQWRRLVQLCHPDRHGGSPAAHAAIQWLLAVRPG